jgi:hypothetical protein
MNFYQCVFINGNPFWYMKSRKEAETITIKCILVVNHGLYFYYAVYQVLYQNKPVVDIMQRTEQWSN